MPVESKPVYTDGGGGRTWDKDLLLTPEISCPQR